jgi:hypothetical protein
VKSTGLGFGIYKIPERMHLSVYGEKGGKGSLRHMLAPPHQFSTLHIFIII